MFIPSILNTVCLYLAYCNDLQCHLEEDWICTTSGSSCCLSEISLVIVASGLLIRKLILNLDFCKADIELLLKALYKQNEIG